MVKNEIIIENSDLFDFYSYQNDNIFHWDDKKRNEFQKKYILETFGHHYSKCSKYKSYCDFLKVTPEVLANTKDLSSIPVIPTAVYKNMKITSVPEEQIVKRCTSSGTQGLISEVYRDEDTICRLINSITVGIKEFYNIDPDGMVVANLGPSTEEAGDIWFSYITSIIDLLGETHYFVKNGTLLCEELEEFIEGFKSEKRLVLLGPPVMYRYFIDYLLRKNKKLSMGEKDLLITAGGWKKFSGEKIEREPFTDLVSENLGIRKENVFDLFNQVELNTVIFECEHKKKHIPPWLRVIVRNPVTLEEVPDGEIGILSYLDSSALSYTCFILSDDFGRVTTGCTCGRTGQVVEIVRRVNRVETKGCAVKIDSKTLKGKGI
jgi:long-chain-fatty-acid---luciferin-component ligase